MPLFRSATWLLAWGLVDRLPSSWQQEPGFAIAPGTPFAISPSGRFMVIGEAWFPK